MDYLHGQTKLQPRAPAKGKGNWEHLDDGWAATALGGADEGDHAVRIVAGTLSEGMVSGRMEKRRT